MQAALEKAASGLTTIAVAVDDPARKAHLGGGASTDRGAGDARAAPAVEGALCGFGRAAELGLEKDEVLKFWARVNVGATNTRAPAHAALVHVVLRSSTVSHRKAIQLYVHTYKQNSYYLPPVCCSPQNEDWKALTAYMRLFCGVLRSSHPSKPTDKLFTLASRAFSASNIRRKYQLPQVDVSMTSTTTKTGQPLDRSTLDSLLRRRLFYTPAFEIYGGVSGLYDYGPPGCSLQANIIDTWRKHFVLEEDMLEVDCTMLTPHEVLKTSGHVEKFADWMCKDPKSGEIFRADHLVEEVLESRLNGNKEARGQKLDVDEEKDARKKKRVKETKAVKLEDTEVKEYEEVLARIDNYNGDELGHLINKYEIKNPATGGSLLPPVAFNLMFQTSIGPSSNLAGYLRPETAQGQFLTFQKLLEFNQQSMPFASACIGKSFRNEISPRSGLLRVREFLMAEIEHFVDPKGGKKHPRFNEVKNIELVLLDRKVQLEGRTDVKKMTVGEAVFTGLVDSESLGYFIARIYLFLKRLGVDQEKLRFRQHMANEMAHYAADCWDAELLTSYGWIECVGCADRSAYDLTVHSKKTGAPLCVRETLAEPLKIEEWAVELDKKKFGPRFKKDGKAVEAAVETLCQDLREKLSIDLAEKGKIEIDVSGVGNGKVEIEQGLIKIEKRTRIERIREYTPNVIEPAFGIGRILYVLMEHVYWTREGSEERGVRLR